MISVTDFGRNTSVFRQVAEDIVKYIHFGSYDIIDEIADRSYIPVPQIEKFFSRNSDLVPDNPAENPGEFRSERVSDIIYNVEYDLNRGDSKGYMTLVMQFVNDTVESYVTVEIQNIRNNK